MGFQPNYNFFSQITRFCQDCGLRPPATSAPLGSLKAAATAMTKRHAMELPRRKFLQLAGAAVAAPAFSRVATAQTYPTHPITMVVPFAPGGASDAIARVLAERMRRSLGQPIVVENMSGANGSIGTGRLARARPDGYTIDLGLPAHKPKTYSTVALRCSLSSGELIFFSLACGLGPATMRIVGPVAARAPQQGGGG
jgi:Tripartite tricarboxylate transporter family receptor